jgi:hypothetical protein
MLESFETVRQLHIERNGVGSASRQDDVAAETSNRETAQGWAISFADAGAKQRE